MGGLYRRSTEVRHLGLFPDHEILASFARDEPAECGQSEASQISLECVRRPPSNPLQAPIGPRERMNDLAKLPQAPAGSLPNRVTDQYANDAFQFRLGITTQEATRSGPATHTTNGDEALCADKSGTYTKCLPQDGQRTVTLSAFTM